MSSAAPALGRVLCATDLSEFGNRAVPFAFAVAAPGGRVTLATVLETPAAPSPLLPRYGEKRSSEDELAALERAAAAQLEALARVAAGPRGIAYEVRVTRAVRVADAILSEADRIDAGAICLATHSRGGLAQLMLGSAAQEVLHRAGRPVLLIPSPLAG
jgi:nucleotide-binding universal stress UspA family protein